MTVQLLPPPPQAPASGMQPNAVPGGAAPQATTRFPTSASALRAIRSQLSDQVQSARSRRSDLAEQLRRAQPGVDRQGLEQQIAQLDARIQRLEADIDETGRLLADATGRQGRGGGTTQPSNWPQDPMNPGQVTAISIVFILFFLFPISIAMAKRLWRGTTPPKATKTTDDSSERLARLEQAVDTVAIEVERISEGQRFVTKILTERAGDQPAQSSQADPGMAAPRALGAGTAPAAPIEVEQREAVPVRSERSA